MDDDADDPTCIVNMLEEFRANAKNYYRSSMLPVNAFREPVCSSSKPKRLLFDGRKSEISDKKPKLETPPSSKGLGDEVMSPWEIRRIKSEVMKSRAQVIEAEERISKLEALNVETTLRYQEEKRTLKKDLDEERSKVKELESRLNFIRKREAEAVDRYNNLKFGENEKENSACKLLSQLQKENHLLKERIFEFEAETENKKKEENNEIMKLSHEISIMKKRNEMNTELIEELRNELIEKNNDLRKLEMEQTKLLAAMKRVKDLESERELYLETRAYVESQNKRLISLPLLEKELSNLKEENERLKSSISNVLYLETEVENLRTRQKLMDNLNQELIELKGENQYLKGELEDWASLSKHYCLQDDKTVKPLILIQRRLEELVKKELWYVSECKDSELRTSHLKEKVDELEKEVGKYKEQTNVLKTSCETHAANIRRLKKQLNLVTWERNDLRNLLDSCQKDVTIASDSHTQFDALQKVIDGYEERLKQLEADPSIAVVTDTKPSALLIERDDLLQRERLLREENKKLREKVEHLSDQLEYRHLKGDFDPRQTKIIHLKANPTSEAAQNYEDRLTKASEEIYRLKERIKVLEEGNNEDVTRIVEERCQGTSVKEISDLKDRLKSAEIQNQRLCEVFRKRSHDFRDAMYMLFGYKVDVLPNNQYRLCSLYAFDPQDILLFQMSSSNNGTMELLETGYSQTLSDMIDLHLKQHKSIPLFLASLTVDLFNKQTITSFSTTVEITTCDS
ncbi:mitotic spindle assembly checkpoint protein MAD1 [Planococcus citri]|uniref:mitotic spindle assembly checkpoint protein MAD1 n=1 Tax=Planococcus citri TaxID=170843 RepID=UPI0031F8CBD9